MEQYKIEAFDGKAISVTEWKPAGEIRGVVQISHGMVEHSLRYNETAERLNERGFLVFADDHRAHGETDKDSLGYSDGDIFENTLRDLNRLTKRYKNVYPDKKLVLFGHSYGSFLAQAYIQRYRLHDAAVIGGSARMNPLLSFGGKIVSSLGCALKGKQAKAYLMNKMTFSAYNKKFSEGNFVSSVPAEAERYASDPYCSFICSYNFYKSFMSALCGLYTKRGLARIDKDKPLLLLSGAKDPVGNFGKDVEKLFETYKKAGIKDVTLKILPNTRHEYFNDVEKEEAYAAFIEFIERVTQ